ncbi:hypothetical protein [Thiohalocapsa marina]|uniref:hypothetical protein n=1 Tax=Thiohalocapsa marina TaxID=424902 RepID=UPI001B8713CD|nr:hypothetical protein [Thiohalocapsa marina]
MPQRTRLPAIAIALAALCLLSPAPDGAHAGVIVQSDMTQEHRAQPGERYRGTIVLRNPGDTTAEAKLYQTDYGFDAEGRNDYGPPGQLPRSNAGWISLTREVVTVPPKGTERIDYEVKVPSGDQLSGTYWSMLMVEPIPETSRESAADLPEGTTSVTQLLRFGIQLVTHIGSSGETALVFSNPQLVKENGKRLFAIDVENTGQRWLRPSLWLELYSQSGNPVGKFEGAATRLYPGTSARFRIDLGETPDGNYLGLVAADGTGDNLFGANVELEIK